MSVEPADLRPSRWTPSNLLSLSRILLAIPTGVAVWNDWKAIAVGLFVVAALTDYLDGFVARKTGSISELGKILDPLADKVYVAVSVLLMLVLGIVPLWFVAVVLGRDILILLGGVYVEKRTGVVLPSNWVGKWAVGALSLTLLLMYLGVEGIPTTVGVVITLLMFAWSMWLYGARAARSLRGDPPTG